MKKPLRWALYGLVILILLNGLRVVPGSTLSKALGFIGYELFTAITTLIQWVKEGMAGQ